MASQSDVRTRIANILAGLSIDRFLSFRIVILKIPPIRVLGLTSRVFGVTVVVRRKMPRVVDMAARPLAEIWNSNERRFIFRLEKRRAAKGAFATEVLEMFESLLISQADLVHRIVPGRDLQPARVVQADIVEMRNADLVRIGKQSVRDSIEIILGI